MRNISEEKSMTLEDWLAYREFMEVLEYLDEEKAPELGLTFDLFL
jgi:hypothetical protein